MGEKEWLIGGAILGIALGILIALAVMYFTRIQAPAASVIFERDESGRITGIYYVHAKTA